MKGFSLYAQTNSRKENILAPVPPMGWMTWNYFGVDINEQTIREMADAMVASGMVKAGFNYIFIDDGWQGGRDNKNNLIPDPKKFPSGIQALADYMHAKGIKLGIYSDAAQLTCAGYTASLGFEEQDAKTFASWEIDYLKYDYCGAPQDSATAITRYTRMGKALHKSGREIMFGICEWGDRKPWYWAKNSGGQLWRTTADIRDKWRSLESPKSVTDLHRVGAGILDIVDINADLHSFAGSGGWNDPDMLMVGLYGKKGPSGYLGGTGCNDIEYQSQMSLWSIMNAPLIAANDLRNMNEPTRRILLNEEVIALNQDPLGQQAERKVKGDIWNVFVKPLSNGDYTVAVLNRSNVPQTSGIDFNELGLDGTYEIRDLWQHKNIGKGKRWKGIVQSHETKLFRLRKL
ncbi:glycoside hydrolase family 27 protein [Chitinophagaceae bacterium LB-8]|uniref:Alpha-galactosidase n=1 Tax=Paraflavisolibacter caeni TaxID=2982496 RepID=A0A9X3B8L2_9BACT|nr:glycoside hydrolase family 27 protein [Paraflavisolibacter caeni]MCU7550880.1 glycoside hydrolase family 27 protein [Paraflavisolibacter caeni]